MSGINLFGIIPKNIKNQKLRIVGKLTVLDLALTTAFVLIALIIIFGFVFMPFSLRLILGIIVGLFLLATLIPVNRGRYRIYNWILKAIKFKFSTRDFEFDVEFAQEDRDEFLSSGLSDEQDEQTKPEDLDETENENNEENKSIESQQNKSKPKKPKKTKVLTQSELEEQEFEKRIQEIKDNNIVNKIESESTNE